jgi:hypothetical protein
VHGEGPELERRVEFTTVVGEQFAWRLRFTVAGMAGAVTYDVRINEHKASGTPVLEGRMPPQVAMVAEATHMDVHAFRPVCDALGADVCDVLGGLARGSDDDVAPRVVGYCAPVYPTHDEARRQLLVALAQPGGEAVLWAALEGEYRKRFVPPLSKEEREEQERIRAIRDAEMKQQGADTVLALQARGGE